MDRPVAFSLHGLPVRLVAPDLPLAPVPDTLQGQLPWLAGPDEPHPRDPATIGGSDGNEQARQLVGAMARGMVEVLQHRRSPSQLEQWMDDQSHLLLLAWSRQHDWSGAQLASVHACRVATRAVEGSVQLRQAGRVFAVLLRLEHAYGRWLVTVFDVISPPAVGSAVA